MFNKSLFIISGFVIVAFTNTLYAANIGFKDLTIGHGINTSIAVWYPTDLKESANTRMGPYLIEGRRNAPIKTGQYPLIVISHGSGGHYLAYRSYAQTLAKSGFIVASVEHPGDHAGDQSHSGTVDNFIHRPKLISLIIDYFIKDSIFNASIDPQKIGLIGHSIGGYTALVLAGVNIGLNRLEAFCKTPDGNTCGDIDTFDADGLLREQSFLDKRIKAVVVMAPVAFVFDRNSFKHVKAKVRIYLPQYDAIVNSVTNGQFFRDHFPKAEVKISANANHFSYITPFPESIQEVVGLPARDRKNFNREEFHETMARELIAFFKNAL